MRHLPTRREGLAVYHADALDLLRSLEPASVDLICTDPPYFRVKDLPWDKQWDTPSGFLAWIETLCVEWKRVLRSNGSLYVFASPAMAGRVEGKIAEVFNVLNVITWDKPPFATKAEMFRKEDLRGYFPASERIVFAEQYGSDELADEGAGWAEQRREVGRNAFGAPLRRAMERAGVNGREVAEAIGAYGSVNHGGAVSNWLLGYNLPTPEQWEALFGYFSRLGCADDLIGDRPTSGAPMPEVARQRYLELRRPFFATDDRPYTDVWEFPTVGTYSGKHPCEKPQSLLRHIITTSSRAGAVVLDCCMGSGSTGEAALSLGREFIGGDLSEHWAQYAAARLDRQFGGLPVGSEQKRQDAFGGLFAEALR